MREILFSENNNNSDALGVNSLENKKIHPAIEYFHDLKRMVASPNLQQFLASFDVLRSIDPAIFAEGVKKFIQLANSNSLSTHSEKGRKALYGNII